MIDSPDPVSMLPHVLYTSLSWSLTWYDPGRSGLVPQLLSLFRRLDETVVGRRPPTFVRVMSWSSSFVHAHPGLSFCDGLAAVPS